MGDERRLTVYRVPGADDVSAKRGADALMPEAHAQDRRGRAEVTHDLGGDTRFRRRAGSRRDDDMAGSHERDLVECHLVAAPDDGLFAQFADVASEVVDER